MASHWGEGGQTGVPAAGGGHQGHDCYRFLLLLKRHPASAKGGGLLLTKKMKLGRLAELLEPHLKPNSCIMGKNTHGDASPSSSPLISACQTKPNMHNRSKHARATPVIVGAAVRVQFPPAVNHNSPSLAHRGANHNSNYSYRLIMHVAFV